MEGIYFFVILFVLIDFLVFYLVRKGLRLKEERRKHCKRKKKSRMKKLNLKVKEEERKKLFNHSKLNKNRNKDNN